MRISDWSSDVCSSDLARSPCRSPAGFDAAGCSSGPANGSSRRRARAARSWTSPAADSTRSKPRSEEHTSELQSLMRISYAVFCLKKKNTNITSLTTDIQQHNNDVDRQGGVYITDKY